MTPDKTFAEVRRRFTASPERVLAVFADRQLVCRWLTPSPEIALDVLQFDFQVGGVYRFAYRVPDGKIMIVGGFFRLIELPSMIVFSWIIEPPDEHAGIPSEVLVTITPDDDGVELLIRHEKLARVDAIKRHAEGWRGAVAQLSELLKTQEYRMVIDDGLAAKVRAALSGTGAIREVKMFGGIGFMFHVERQHGRGGIHARLARSHRQ